MAAPPVAPFRVRYGDGAFQLVRLAPGRSEAGIERVVALATGLAVGTLGLRAAEGVSGFHAGLAGDWEAVQLPGVGAGPAAAGAGGGALRSPQSSLATTLLSPTSLLARLPLLPAWLPSRQARPNSQQARPHLRLLLLAKMPLLRLAWLRLRLTWRWSLTSRGAALRLEQCLPDRGPLVRRTSACEALALAAEAEVARSRSRLFVSVGVFVQAKLPQKEGGAGAADAR